jgi:DNA repair exonuclease SbcCD ATPase subunit
MRICSIRIRDFRKLTGPVCIDRIGDGITVISGDNEEGKSTVLEAIRSVLFTRHRILGDAAERMQPFGQSVRPEISLDFEIGGKRYALRKAFCRRAEAELTWTGGRATGDAAEDKLQELLRFVPPGKGAAKAEHQGIWGLFWVAQGTSFKALRMSDGSRQTLTSALEGEVGQVLGGDRGRALLQTIRGRCEEMFTVTGRPREYYRKSLEAIEALERDVAKLQTALQAYEEKINHLERVRSRLRTYDNERILQRAQDQLRVAEAANQRLMELQDRLRVAQNAVEIARSKRDATDERWTSRAKKIEAATRARGEADTAARREAEARRTLEPLKHLLGDARAAEEEKRRAYGESEAILGAAEQDLRRARAERELAELQGRRRKAAEAINAAQAARATGLAISVDDAKLARLRELEKAAGETAVRLRAFATRLDFAPDGVRRISSDLGDVPPDQPLLLTETTTLRLEQFGEITITPGGEDLGGLRLAAKSAEDELRRALAARGVTDLAAAARAADQRQKLLAEAETQERLARVHAPEGLEALDAGLRLKQAEQATLQQGAIRPAPVLEAAEAEVNAASVRRAAALRMFTEQKTLVEDLERQCREAREVWIKLQALHQGAATQADRSAQELQEDRACVPDAELREAVANAAAALATSEAISEAAEEAYNRENPEAIALRLEEARAAARHTQEDLDRLRKAASDMEIELRALGQQGLGEDLAAAQGELDQARKRFEAVEREAKAIKFLYDTLRQAEREAKDAFLGPVRKRVQPYLDLLFPGAELELGQDTLDIRHLRRGELDEPFDCLSIGTQEQLAILTRLAFADFLRERGQPAAVILDDALAYSDCNRFDRMQLVLRKASKNLQVIVLTCRERDYIGRGLPIVRLADCRTPETVA